MSRDSVEYRGVFHLEWVGLLVSFAFILAGIKIALLPGRTLLSCGLGSGVALVGVLLLGLALLPLQASRLRLRLDKEGIHSKSPFDVYGFDLAWTQVTGVRIESFKNARLVVIDAPGAERSFDEVGRTVRPILESVNSPFVLLAKLYGLSPEALRDEIERRRRPVGMEGTREG